MKLNKSITLLLSALMLASCGGELVQEARPGGKAGNEGSEVGLRAGISTTLTRTWLDSEGGGTALQVYWSDGDRINVNGQNSAPLSITSGDKVSDAEFLLRSVTPPYNIVYPAGIVTSEAYDPDGCISISIPATQEYKPGSFGNGAAVLYGWSDNTEERVQLKNLCAAVRVQLKGDASEAIDFAELCSAGPAVAGGFSLKPKDGTFSAVDGTNTISLELGEGAALASEGTWFYFTIPTNKYADGLVFTFKQASDHRAMICTWTPADSLKAGVLYSFSDVTFAPGAKDIETPDDWNEFAATLNNGGDMRKWLRDGTVYLGADISAADLDKVNVRFVNKFDGQGYTITRTEGSGSLFSSIRGEVSNLKLAGAISSTGITVAALADSLIAGGTVRDCVNGTNITVNAATYTRAGGFFGIVRGGQAISCVNNGNITGSVDCSENEVVNLQLGGIVGQVDVTVESSEDILLKDCSNTGAILADPVCNIDESTYGIRLAGIGGIAGWLRGTLRSFTLDNCDNSGSITYSGEHVKPITGTYQYAVSVGGIVGIAGDINSTYGIYGTSIGANGLDVTIKHCDNTGTVHNCGIVNSKRESSNNDCYTGGIAGTLVGTAEKYASLDSCSNRGTVLTYDLFGDQSAKNPEYCHVAGGLIGYGGYVSIDECLVSCTIGNAVRASTSMGGCLGFAMRPFSITNSTVWFEGLWTRVSAFHLNSAGLAVVSMTDRSKDMSPKPDIKGSVVSGCKVGGKVYYIQVSEGSIVDSHSGIYTTNSPVTLTANTASAVNIVRGEGYNTASVTTTDVSFSGNSAISEAP